jgi:hypothetical protein
MAKISKIPQGKLNYDASKALLPANDYNDALNINIDSDGVRSVKGNRLLDEAYSATGYWCAGSYYDKTRRRVYAFMAHSNQQHRIVAVDVATSTITTLFENETDSGTVDIFGWAMPATFDASKVIKNICVVHRDFGGDLVYFIDPNKIPLKFNYDTLLADGYGTTPTLEMFKVICPPPVAQPNVAYADDATRSINNLKKKLFQFKYRFVYSDDEKSVWSAISNLALPPQNDDQDYYADGTKANVLNVFINSGIKTVAKIEIAARNNIASAWSDFYLVDTLVKDELAIADNASYQYRFYNDGAYDYVDLEESNLLFDYVPDEANTMTLANGNVLVYGGIKEGLNKEVELDVDATVTMSGATVTNVIITSSYISATSWSALFTGTVTENDLFSILINYYDVPDRDDFFLESISYTALSGDTIDDVIDAIVLLINAEPNLTAVNSGGGVMTVTVDAGFELDGLDGFVSGGASASNTDSISIHKWKGRYRYGIAYYRNDGKTRGVYVPTDNSWTIDIPAYQEATAVPQVPTVTLKITNAPPSWADYFHIVRTKELTSLSSKFIVTSGCGQDTDNHYLKIDNLTTHVTDFPSTAAILNYEYREGDRVRMLKNQTSSTVLDSYDYEVIGVVTDPTGLAAGDYIKIRRTTATDTYGFSTAANKYYIEIFSPAATVENDLNVYYETAKRFAITTDVNGNRVHAGNTQTQIIGAGAQDAEIEAADADYYVRERTLTTGASGTFTTYVCMDANFSDGYLSAVHNEGRPLVIDDNIKEQYYPGLIRHSLQYIQGTNVNELSRFYADNFEEADISFGDVLNMRTRENFIRVFQRFKVGMVPVLRQIYFDTSGSTTVATSERILNKINYYAGDYGIDRYGLSLVSTDNGDYFIDDINRCLVRASLDGITNISETFEASVWWQANVQNGYSGIGYFDYENRLIVLAVIKTDNTKDYVIGFSEKRKGFMSRYSYTAAESFLFVDGYPWSFYQGKPYVHDSASRCTFFGTTTAPFITLVFNDGVDFKKSFTNIATVSNRKWGATAIATSTGQASNLKIEDFKMREDGYHAAFLRDTNSPKGLNGGDPLKGNWIEVKLEGGAASSLDATPRDEIDATDEYNVTLVAVYFNESNLNKR